VSQNPLESIRRKQPRQRGVFPDPSYVESVLGPEAGRVEAALEEAVTDFYRQHAIVLAEQRIIEPALAARALKALDALPAAVDYLPQHPLSGVEARIVAAASDDVLLGRAPEEVAIAAIRIVLRGAVLEYHGALLDLREAVAELAAGHLTTLLLTNSNGQVVEPTSLGHYLSGQLGPMARAGERLHGVFERINRSPVGAVSGMSTAMPVRRERSASLLGFDGLIDSTFDAIAGTDLFTDVAGVVAGLAIELSRFVADLAWWARDDVGLMVPDDAFIHAPGIQPQRRDPAVHDHLRVRLAEQAAGPQALTTLLFGRQMLGSDTTRYAAFFQVSDLLQSATATMRVLTYVLRSIVVNRSLFANRTNRGFSTSSELADLLAIDFQLPAERAHVLTQRVVIEWSEQGGEAATLTPDFIDTVALQVLGREIGIEPEMLAKCLSPKRFIERRDVTGGPAPSAVTSALDRAHFGVRRERGWLLERQQQLAAARAVLLARKDEIMAEPGAAISRSRSGAGGSEIDVTDTI
jgi:argininosuccinate lyase